MYPKLKELRVAGDHGIQDVWEGNVAFKAHAILDENGVDWTSANVVCMGYAKESASSVILWIGVKPSSLSYDNSITATLQCKALLQAHSIDNVEVEICKLEVIHSTGPKLLEPTFNRDLTVDLCKPFTATLSIIICAQLTPQSKGTGSFLIKEGGDGKRPFLVTAHHVVLPFNKGENTIFNRDSDIQCCHNVLILSDMSFQQHLTSIADKIEGLKTTSILFPSHCCWCQC